MVVGGGLEQRGSDGPAAAAWAETQLDLLIEPHITLHALYYQAVPEEKRQERVGRKKPKTIMKVKNIPFDPGGNYFYMMSR